jgi:hypothetical protein
VRYVCIEERLEKRRTVKGCIQHTYIHIDVHTLGHCVALLVGEVWLTGTVKCRPLEEEASKKGRWGEGGQREGGGGGDEH